MSDRICTCCGARLHDNATICHVCNTINRSNSDQNFGGQARKYVHTDSKKASSAYYSGQSNSKGNTAPQNDLDALLNETTAVKKSLKTLTAAMFVFLVLCILASGFVYHFFIRSDTFVFSESSIVTHKVLILSFESGIDKDDQSDPVQVNNALRNGGQLRILDELEGYNYSFDRSTYQKYGASNADGHYYIRGAIINYIASNGWELIQGPTTGLLLTYYFVK